jgi:hypothetical protein
MCPKKEKNKFIWAPGCTSVEMQNTIKKEKIAKATQDKNQFILKGVFRLITDFSTFTRKTRWKWGYALIYWVKIKIIKPSNLFKSEHTIQIFLGKSGESLGVEYCSRNKVWDKRSNSVCFIFCIVLICFKNKINMPLYESKEIWLLATAYIIGLFQTSLRVG